MTVFNFLHFFSKKMSAQQNADRKGKRRLTSNTNPDALFFKTLLKKQESRTPPQKKPRFVPFITPTKTPKLNDSSPEKSPLLLNLTTGRAWTREECTAYARYLYTQEFEFIEEIHTMLTNPFNTNILLQPFRPYTKDTFLRLIVLKLIQSKQASVIFRDIKNFYELDLQKQVPRKQYVSRRKELLMIFTFLRRYLPEEILYQVKECLSLDFENIQNSLDYHLQSYNMSTSFLIKAATLQEFHSKDRRVYVNNVYNDFHNQEVTSMYQYDFHIQFRYGLEYIVTKIVIYQSLYNTPSVFIKEKVIIEKRRCDIPTLYNIVLRTHYDFLVREHELLQSML